MCGPRSNPTMLVVHMLDSVHFSRYVAFRIMLLSAAVTLRPVRASSQLRQRRKLPSKRGKIPPGHLCQSASKHC